MGNAGRDGVVLHPLPHSATPSVGLELLGAWHGAGQWHHGAAEGNAPHLGTQADGPPPQPSPREPGRPSKDGDARGDGAACPSGVAGTAGSWERQRTGTELEAGVGHVPEERNRRGGRVGGCRGPKGVAGHGGGEAGCTSGGGGVAGSVALARPPLPCARPPRGPGGLCRCQMLCSCLQRFLSPPPPRPVPHILREALPCASSAGRAGGRHPPPAPRSSGPGFLSRRVCLLQISALLPPVHSPHLLSHLSPASRSLFFLLPAASPSSQPWGFSPLCCLLILGRILLSSLLPWLQSSLRSLGQRGGQGGGSIGHHLLIFFPLVSKYFAFSRSAGAGLAGSCPAPNQPRHHGQGKAGRAAASVAVGCRGVWAAGAGGDVHCWRLTPTAGHR